jgi:anti-sigma regulatory factor (Ser/Thr protein kinase)
MRTQHPSGGEPERLVYERALPAVPLAVGRMRHELDAALDGLAVSQVRRHDVALVLTEAAANVVVHAYAGASPGLLYTVAALSGPSLSLHVFDRGRGMVPNAHSPGLGVGLALMAQLTDGLDITPNGEGGLRVTALFRGIAPPAQAPAAPPAPTLAERVQAYADTLPAGAQDPIAAAETAIAQAQRLRVEQRF